MRRLGQSWPLAAAALAAFLAGVAVTLALGQRQESRPALGEIWREIAWPFPRDAWPPGRAFRCLSAQCGEGTEVYVRTKIGLCSNCALGVADDAEVDRVADLDLISERFVSLRAGAGIRVGDMPGRARRYTLHMPGGEARTAMGLAVSRGCDLVVAAVLWPSAPAPDVEVAPTQLLSSPRVTSWLSASLSGG
jgi:hypothetical protein